MQSERPWADGVVAGRFRELFGLRALASPDRAFWVGAALVAAFAATTLLGAFRHGSLPPGGDPGNWVATSYAYLGRPFPSEIAPLAYPPLLFPIIGAAVAVAGPVLGVDLFAAGLIAALTLSTALLASEMLGSRWVAWLATGFFIADPPILAMFFWGAYPNLLGFVFLNVALVGLLRAGRGHTSSGAALFWLGFTLTALTHSLVAVVLAGTVALYLILGALVPLPSWGTALDRARAGSLEEPGVAVRALFASRGGRGGLLVFVGLVGGYYAASFLLGVPHPYYFSSVAAGLRTTSMTGALQALLPNVPMPAPVVVGLLLGASGALLAGFAVLRRARPQSLTSGAVLLIAWPIAVATICVAGFLAGIVTDYHRFGFCLVLPIALGAGTLLDRSGAFGGPQVGPDPEAAPSGPGRPDWPRRVRGFVVPRDGRPSGLAVTLGVAALIAVSVGASGPALLRDETVFTKTGHDDSYLAAIQAIRSSGEHGGILTVPAADQWTRGLTSENSFAPYSTSTFLFYPFQQASSQLSFYSLTGRYSLSNGAAVLAVHGTSPANLVGIPEYSVNLLGSARELLRVPVGEVRVTLHDTVTGRSLVQGLNGTPIVGFPDPATMVLSFVEPGWWFNVTTAGAAGGNPGATVGFSVEATPPLTVAALSATVTPVPGSGGQVVATGDPGAFLWTNQLAGVRPTTLGTVYPSSAYQGATSFDPTSGTPAARLGFRAPTGAARLTGSLNLSTGSGSATGLAGAFTAPGIWAELGIRFILWPSASSPVSGSPVPGAEVRYLTSEYGLPVLYQDDEWTVLEVPPAGAGGPTPAAGGGPG